MPLHSDTKLHVGQPLPCNLCHCIQTHTKFHLNVQSAVKAICTILTAHQRLSATSCPAICATALRPSPQFCASSSTSRCQATWRLKIRELVCNQNCIRGNTYTVLGRDIVHTHARSLNSSIGHMVKLEHHGHSRVVNFFGKDTAISEKGAMKPVKGLRRGQMHETDCLKTLNGPVGAYPVVALPSL